MRVVVYSATRYDNSIQIKEPTLDETREAAQRLVSALVPASRFSDLDFAALKPDVLILLGSIAHDHFMFDDDPGQH
jgi:hypothetical protein